MFLDDILFHCADTIQLSTIKGWATCKQQSHSIVSQGRRRLLVAHNALLELNKGLSIKKS